MLLHCFSTLWQKRHFPMRYRPMRPRTMRIPGRSLPRLEPEILRFRLLCGRDRLPRMLCLPVSGLLQQKRRNYPLHSLRDPLPSWHDLPDFLRLLRLAEKLLRTLAIYSLPVLPDLLALSLLPSICWSVQEPLETLYQ